MSNRSVLIASPSRKNGRVLQREVLKLRRELRSLTAEVGSIADVNKMQASAVILSMPEWSFVESNILSELRALGYDGPVLVMGDIPQEGMDRLDEMFGPLKFLPSPVRKHDFRFAVREMLADETGAHEALRAIRRAHERFETEESVQVEISGKRMKYEAELLNISSGGACVEMPEPLNVRIGDWARATIHLEELEKTHFLRARVAWIEERSNGGPILGLSFWRPRELLNF